ncbi:MAG: hypothetical protein V7739_18940 [Motiliproteus sp.]
MNTAGLSLDNIPAFKVPMRFFLVAPWFGILASLCLLLHPEAFASRWNPAMLSFVHLLTLGFAAMVMLGAMIQVLPVVSSQQMPTANHTTHWIRAFLALGCLSLSVGFLFNLNAFLGISIVLLALAFILFLSFMGIALVRTGRGGATLLCLRLAALSLLGTVLLGVLQLSTYLELEWITYLAERTDDHAMLGLLGWGMLLIMGVSFQVIPMFHVAPAFPKWLTWTTPTALFLSLSAAIITDNSFHILALILALTAVITYAFSALSVLYRRKRKLPDYTVRFWQFALSNLALVASLSLLELLIPGILPTHFQPELALGFGFGIGFVLSVILGMLQKIVPFLMYLHLQRACLHDPTAFMALPNMKQLIPSKRSKWQYRLHIMTVLGIYLCFLLQQLQSYMAVITALLMLSNFSWLLRSLLLANSRYNKSLPASSAPTTVNTTAV